MIAMLAAAEPEMPALTVNTEARGEALLLALVEALVERIECLGEMLLRGGLRGRRLTRPQHRRGAVRFAHLAYLFEMRGASLCAFPHSRLERWPVLLLCRRQFEF